MILKRKGEISMICPPDWRNGQTIVNFLWWLIKKRPELPQYQKNTGMMIADPFYIEDNEWDQLYLEFLNELPDTLWCN
jgi:hypothetical protein